MLPPDDKATSQKRKKREEGGTEKEFQKEEKKKDGAGYKKTSFYNCKTCSDFSYKSSINLFHTTV